MALRLLVLDKAKMKFEVKDLYGESFNFVPRFFRLVFEDGSVVAAKPTQPVVVVMPNETTEVSVTFVEPFRFESRNNCFLCYGVTKLATLTTN